jgi:AcrR family transcriptional regulator
MVVEPMRDRRAERHEATKAEILEAAWELVRAEGLAALSLRDLAGKVGMRAPSLYSYFESKHAIYDAMFAQGYRQNLERRRRPVPEDDPLAGLRELFLDFVSFCTEDPARYQLLFQRTIPGFEPSEESWALGLRAYEEFRAQMARLGVTDQADLDLATALGTGLVDQQISNDPGGDRWTSRVDDAVEMLYRHLSDRQQRKAR